MYSWSWLLCDIIDNGHMIAVAPLGRQWEYYYGFLWIFIPEPVLYLINVLIVFHQGYSLPSDKQCGIFGCVALVATMFTNS